MMGSILNNATLEEERIAQDLLKLGAKRAGRVAGEVIRELRENFCREAGLFITDHGTIRHLFLKSEQPVMMPYRPPADDHGRLVFWEGARPIVYLSQPYGLGHDSIRQIVAFGDRWGLDVDINPAIALWYPGKTCAIAYSIPGATYNTPWETMAE